MSKKSFRREKRSEIPEKCPMLRQCEELVDESWFQYRCGSRDWLYCLPPKVREQTDDSYRKPREWLKKKRYEEEMLQKRSSGYLVNLKFGFPRVIRLDRKKRDKI
jgi:hypothetical protein